MSLYFEDHIYVSRSAVLYVGIPLNYSKYLITNQLTPSVTYADGKAGDIVTLTDDFLWLSFEAKPPYTVLKFVLYGLEKYDNLSRFFSLHFPDIPIIRDISIPLLYINLSFFDSAALKSPLQTYSNYTRVKGLEYLKYTFNATEIPPKTVHFLDLSVQNAEYKTSFTVSHLSRLLTYDYFMGYVIVEKYKIHVQPHAYISEIEGHIWRNATVLYVKDYIGSLDFKKEKETNSTDVLKITTRYILTPNQTYTFIICYILPPQIEKIPLFPINFSDIVRCYDFSYDSHELQVDYPLNHLDFLIPFLVGGSIDIAPRFSPLGASYAPTLIAFILLSLILCSYYLQRKIPKKPLTRLKIPDIFGRELQEYIQLRKRKVSLERKIDALNIDYAFERLSYRDYRKRTSPISVEIKSLSTKINRLEKSMLSHAPVEIQNILSRISMCEKDIQSLRDELTDLLSKFMDKTISRRTFMELLETYEDRLNKLRTDLMALLEDLSSL
ncbi:hypothetical protein DRN58_05630 [Thermococci archaeon]|nr:MAG: hypothetical protein DRN58_05630 [Thermococci archaeon]